MSELTYSRPGTDSYRAATTPRNSSASQHPALVASPRSAAELAAAVGYAARHGLTAVPQATGHGASGELGDGVLFIDTARLDTVHIDAGRRRAVVGAGCQWGAINAAAERHGLLGRSGSAPDVSVCGFTFGGGAGWLTRPHGLASGALAAVDFVDGTGRIRRASDDAPDEGDREAIYAFRGGGGVGVAAALEFDLASVTDLWAGYLLWPFEHLNSVAGAWAGALARIGQALSTSISVLSAPPGPPFPPGLQGTRAVHLAAACSTGDADAAPLFDALSAVATPTVNTWGRADAARLGGVHLDPPAAGPALGIAHWLDAAPSVAPAVLRAAADSPIEMIEIRNVGNDAPVLDGAMTRPIGDFILHALGDQSDPQGREAAFAPGARGRGTRRHQAVPRLVGGRPGERSGLTCAWGPQPGSGCPRRRRPGRHHRAVKLPRLVSQSSCGFRVGPTGVREMPSWSRRRSLGPVAHAGKLG